MKTTLDVILNIGDSAAVYENGLGFLRINEIESWYYKGKRLNGINSMEEALKYLELKAFW